MSSYDFRTVFANRNRLVRKRYALRRKLYHWLPLLEPLIAFSQRRREAKRWTRARRPNLWSGQKNSAIEGRSEVPEIWHIRALNAAIPPTRARYHKPLVSVIVPVYNVESYVGRTLKSLIGQSYENIEILVVNDGSTDSTAEICKAASETDGRVRLYHKPNGGLGSARNFGIERAQGDYISFVDGDDWVLETFVERFLANASPTTDVVVCDHTMAYPDGRRFHDIRCGWDTHESDGIKHLFLTDVECYAWNKLYRRECFNRSDFRFSDGLFEDLAVVPAILGSSRSIAFTREIDYIYVQRPTSILASARTSAERQFSIFDAFDKLINKQPFFRADLWAHYYEYKLAKHLFLFRKDPIIAVPDPDTRQEYVRRFGRELAARMPHWHETEVIRSFIKEGRSLRRKAKRLALVRQFMEH